MTVWGIKNGFGGLVKNEMTKLSLRDTAGLLARGGTILGTTNRDNPFHFPVEGINGETVYADMSGQAIRNLQAHQIEALIVIGGDGSLYIANELHAKYAFPVVGVPKTIDNDLPETERTFGFDTAVSIATEALDRLHTTAESHHRVMLLEVMGRYAGWIALHAGIGGGADCILMPEIPFRLAAVLHKIKERKAQGKLFSIIVVAEGAFPEGGSMTVARVIEGSADKIRLGGIGNKLVSMIEEQGQMETRCTVLGHLQRGGSPTAYDRILATRYGVAAAEAVRDEEFGCMVALQNNAIRRVPLARVVGKPFKVPPEHELIKVGRSIGVSFGDI